MRIKKRRRLSILPVLPLAALLLTSACGRNLTPSSDSGESDEVHVYVSADSDQPRTIEQLLNAADLIAVGTVGSVYERTPVWVPSEADLTADARAAVEQESFVSSTSHNAWQTFEVREVLSGDHQAEVIELVTNAVTLEHPLVRDDRISFEVPPIGPLDTDSVFLAVLVRYPDDSPFAGAYGVVGDAAGIGVLDGRRVVGGSDLLRAIGTLDELPG